LASKPAKIKDDIMGRSHLAFIIRLRYRKAAASAKALPDELPEQAIHDFRLQVKHLRALLRMAASSKRTSIKRRLPPDLDVFYRMTGVIRNLHVQRNALITAGQRLEQTVPAACVAILEGRIDTVTEMLMHYRAGRMPYGKMQQTWWTRVASADLREAAYNFLQQHMKLYPDPSSKALPDDETLHILRKGIKDLLFTWSILPERSIKLAQTEMSLSKDALEAGACLLGDFRDLCLSLALLQDNHFLQVAGPQARLFLDKVADTWQQDKYKLKSDIRRILLRAVEPVAQNPLVAPNLNNLSYELHVD
jgi:CHAD domain-containing protein